MKPDFTVITPTFNSSETIKDTLASVFRQKNVSIEYLIIDGISLDNTIEICNRFLSENINDQITCKVIQEKDNGVYDAMNKGINLAKGTYIAILNSDDIFSNFSILETIKEKFEEGNDVVYGDLDIVDFNLSKTIRRWEVGRIPKEGFCNAWHPAHPSFFMSKKGYLAIGNFDTRMKIAADYDLMLRALTNPLIKSTYINHTTTLMRIGGLANGSFKSIIKGNMEVLKSLKKNNIKTNFTKYLLKRVIMKVRQYYK